MNKHGKFTISTFISIFISLQLLFSAVAFGQSASINIHEICKYSPAECLANIDQSLNSVSKQSRLWFQYKLYQLDALFQLVKDEQLKTEIAQWIDVEEVPLKFKINVYILHAKNMRFDGNKELAEEYLNKAIDILESVSELYSDPMLTIQIANALNYLGKNQQGHDMLVALDKKYSNRDDPLLKLELYENLGHFSARLGYLDEHIDVRHKALTAAQNLGNIQRLAGAIYNVARAYEKADKDDQAIQYFTDARSKFLIANDDYGAEIALMRLAQIDIKHGNIESARSWYKQIDLDVIYQYHTKELDELAKTIEEQSD